MKPTKITPSHRDEAAETSVVREIGVVPGIGQAISVRAAKAHLSGLLDLVARGREIVITSGGQPKARITPYVAAKPRKVFPGAEAHLAKMGPWRGGPTGTELIRADRDSRP